uniref:Uncharacterized protein n=1 Tax=Sphaerodactylus townsendi TaxID=933632 RepID=A0ACB8GDJ8_9SAUR
MQQRMKACQRTSPEAAKSLSPFKQAIVITEKGFFYLKQRSLYMRRFYFHKHLFPVMKMQHPVMFEVPSGTLCSVMNVLLTFHNTFVGTLSTFTLTLHHHFL